MVSAGYAIADIAALKAIGESARVHGYARLVESDGNGFPAWYMFNTTSTATPDNNLVVIPNDNPTVGRFLKVGGAAIALQETDLDMADWKLIDSNYQAISGDKLLVYSATAISEYTISLPTPPTPGDEVKFLLPAATNSILFNFNGSPYLGSDTALQRIQLSQVMSAVSLIYIGAPLGWVESRNSVISVQNNSSS